jgi:hypothetical protein
MNLSRVMRYCGSRTDLVGCTALVRMSKMEGFVEIQFTPLHLPPELTHGWTEYLKEDFEDVPGTD